MKDALREIVEQAGAGYRWPERSSRPPPSALQRVVRGALWATYTARERLAVWIDPGPPFSL